MRTTTILSALLLALVALVPRDVTPVAVAESVDLPIVAVPEAVDEPITPELAGLPEDPIVIPPVKVMDCTVYAYPVRARGHRLVNGQYVAVDPPPHCTAISIGKGRFLTAGHLVDSLSGGVEVDIQVDGKWVNKVAYRRAADRDALTITTDLDVPGVEVRAPEYREKVTVYGLETGSPLDGLYCGILSTGKSDSFVSLDPSESGVIPGDSGGGVFGEDGCLIGIVQGYGAERKNVSTILVADMESEPVKEAPKAAPVQAPRSGCPGGICPAPQSVQRQTYFPRRRR